VGEGLKALGVEPDKVEHVIATHMHWDHAGNYDLFPNARYHVQDTEMAYATGRCMCHQTLRIPFSERDVHAMIGGPIGAPVIAGRDGDGHAQQLDQEHLRVERHLQSRGSGLPRLRAGHGVRPDDRGGAGGAGARAVGPDREGGGRRRVAQRVLVPVAAFGRVRLGAAGRDRR